jgi:hypothetical protein
MPQTSFIISCIEFYAEHAGHSSTETYALFVRSGLLKWLRKDYEDLHGLSFEYLMQFFDEYFNNAA